MILKDALDAFIKAFADLEKAARSDDKTPLQNALALSEAKDLFATTDDSPNVFIFADINDFKFVNGEYGYAAGDSAISKVGILIQELFVKDCNAQAFRQSGDEFVILLQDKFLDDFKEKATSFSACFVQGGEKSFSVGVSFGYAVSDNELGFETMQTRAETACKQAKKQGDGVYLEWTKEIELNAVESLRKNCSCGAVTTCYVPLKMKLNKIQFCAVCGVKLS